MKERSIREKERSETGKEKMEEIVTKEVSERAQSKVPEEIP